MNPTYVCLKHLKVLFFAFFIVQMLNYYLMLMYFAVTEENNAISIRSKNKKYEGYTGKNEP